MSFLEKEDREIIFEQAEILWEVIYTHRDTAAVD